MAWSNEARPLKATILMQLVSGLDNPHVLYDTISLYTIWVFLWN